LVAVRCRLEFARSFNNDPILAREPPDMAVPSIDTDFLQVIGHPWAAIAALTMQRGAARFAATAAVLDIAPVKRFPDPATAARRIWANLIPIAAAAAAPEVAAGTKHREA
jgi:hypothetical protein